MRKLISYVIIGIFGFFYVVYKVLERKLFRKTKKVIVYKDNLGYFHYVYSWKQMLKMHRLGDVDSLYTPTEMTLYEYDQLGGSEK